MKVSSLIAVCFISKIIINLVRKLSSKVYILRTGGIAAWKRYLDIEKLELKVCRTRAHLSFLRRCYTNDIIPKFLLFRLPRQDWRDDRVVHVFRKRLLQLEIYKQEKLLVRQSHSVNITFPSVDDIGVRLWIAYKTALAICIHKEAILLNKRHA
jgi:hypothetical protein